MLLDQLKTFYAVAKSGGFERATESVHLSQPAISIRIKELEKQLGVQLFKRSGRRVQLTDAGKLVMEYTARVTIVLSEMNLAIEKGEAHCRSGTVSAYVGREPTRTWIKSGFVRALVQSGATRYPKLPETPTIYELLESHKAPDTAKRVTKVMLSSGDLGRPFFAPPGTPAVRVNVLRAAFSKTMNDPELLAEAKKRAWDIDLLAGEDLEKIAKEIIVQPPEVIERVKKMLGS